MGRSGKHQLGLAHTVCYAYQQLNAIMQFHLNLLSDDFGRKQYIIIGHLFLLLGGISLCSAESRHLVIIGRGLQGARCKYLRRYYVGVAACLTVRQIETRGIWLWGGLFIWVWHM